MCQNLNKNSLRGQKKYAELKKKCIFALSKPLAAMHANNNKRVGNKGFIVILYGDNENAYK